MLLVGIFLPFSPSLSSDVLSVQAVDEHCLQGAAHGVGIGIFTGYRSVQGHILLLQGLHGSHQLLLDDLDRTKQNIGL